MTRNDDGRGKLRFKHDDLVIFVEYVLEDGQAVRTERRGRITTLSDTAGVVDTVTGPRAFLLSELRAVPVAE